MAARLLRFPIALALASLPLLALSLTAPRAEADTATHAFPIRGLHSYGGEVSQYGYARGRLHRGQDMAADAGTPLVAVTDGRVSYRQYQGGGAGHYVVIQGDDGRDSVYMHMQSRAFVAPGERVRKGQLIGRVGSTGSSTGPHLHFELWTSHWYAGGSAYDPLPSLRRWDVPRRPSGLTAQSGSDQVALDWADNPPEGDLAGYRVYRRTADTSYTRIASTGGSSYVDRTVRSGETYYYRVKAVDRLSNLGRYSNYVTGRPTAADTTRPARPEKLTATSGSGRVSLDWSDNTESDLAGYRVYRRTPDTNYALIDKTRSSSYLDTSVRGGETYYYRVKAYDASGNWSYWSTNYATGRPTVAAYEQVVDNGDPERFAASASWARGTWNTQRQDADYRYAKAAAVSDSARFRLRVPRSGSYEVYAWHPAGSSYSAGAPIGVKTTEGMRWKRVDQRSDGGRWVSLGVHPLTAGDRESVFVSRWTSAPGYVVADAVRIAER